MNIGIVLSSLLVSMMIFSWEMEFAFVEPEGEGFHTIVMYSLVGYLLYLLRYFVVNEEKKYTVSAFTISVMVSTVVIVTYDQRVGGHFWNDDYVLEEALLASVQSTIILFVINELAGIAFGAYNSSANAKRNYPTSPNTNGAHSVSTACCNESALGLGFGSSHPHTCSFLCSVLGIYRSPINLSGPLNPCTLTEALEGLAVGRITC